MSEKDPATKEEYEKKFAQNQKITGGGLGTTMHYPCPACAEPGFMKHTILEAETAIAAGGVCQCCGRGFKGIVEHIKGGTQVEFVQTQGEDCPPYLPPIRRVDDGLS